MSEQNGKALTAAEMLADQDSEPVRHRVAFMSGHVYVAEIRADEWCDIERRFIGQGRKFSDDPSAFRAHLLRRCVLDENGKAIFDEENVKKLLRKRRSVIEPLFEEVVKVNAISKGDVETLEKNSESSPGE